MCVRSQQFLAANDVQGSFMANGVLGLAPAKEDKSIIWHMFLQGQIFEPLVGLNFEDPSDPTVVSQMHLGYYAY
jgi:hypothetical protein